MHLGSRARGDENWCVGQGVVSGNRPDASGCLLPPPCPNPLTVLGLSPPNLPPFLPKLDVSPFSTFSCSPHPPVLQGCESRAERGAPLLRAGSHETGRTALSFPPGAAAPPPPSAAQEAPPAPGTKLQRSAATVSPRASAFLSCAPSLEEDVLQGLLSPSLHVRLPAAAGCTAWGAYAGLQKRL